MLTRHDLLEGNVRSVYKFGIQDRACQGFSRKEVVHCTTYVLANEVVQPEIGRRVASGDHHLLLSASASLTRCSVCQVDLFSKQLTEPGFRPDREPGLFFALADC